jgi:hypothetical protein
MSSETCRLELESPPATLPPANWAVICTDEQFWDSRLHVWPQITRLSSSVRYRSGTLAQCAAVKKKTTISVPPVQPCH